MEPKTTLRAKFNWYKYWYITRHVNRLGLTTAHHLPKWLKYWVYIDVVSNVTARDSFKNRTMPHVGVMEVLEEYAK